MQCAASVAADHTKPMDTDDGSDRSDHRGQTQNGTNGQDSLTKPGDNTTDVLPATARSEPRE